MAILDFDCAGGYCPDMPRMTEFISKRCPTCGGDSIRDVETLTGPGWALTFAGIGVGFLGFLLLAFFSLPIPFVIALVSAGAGLVGYARKQLYYQSNQCLSCGAAGTFEMVTITPPDKK